VLSYLDIQNICVFDATQTDDKDSEDIKTYTSTKIATGEVANNFFS
jgi:hypothetical protein